MRALRRGAPFALFVTAIAVIVALILTQRMDPVYEARASVVAARPTSALGGIDLISAPPVDPRVYQRALNDGTIVQAALLRFDGRERGAAEMLRFMERVNVSVESHDISSVIGIGVRDSDPQRAATVANLIAAQLIEWDRDRGRAMLDDTIAAIERAIRQIDAQIAEAVDSEDQASAQRLQMMSATQRENLMRELDVARSRSASAVVVGQLESLTAAQPPVEPVAPRPVFNVFVAVLLGLLFGYGLQFARWSLDTRVSSSGALGEAAGLPVLGRLAVPRRGLRLPGESTSALRSSLVGVLGRQGSTVVGVVSASTFKEKSGVATSLADSLARSNYRTLIIDADLIRKGPGYGVDITQFLVPHLEEYLREPDLRFEPLSFAIDAKRSFDALIPGGSEGPLSGPVEARFGALVDRVRELYDVVVIDVPPLLANPDAASVASICDAVLLCVGADATRAEVRSAAGLLERGGANVIGAFLTEERSAAAAPRRGGKVDVKPVTRGEAAGAPKGDPRGEVRGDPLPRAYARVKPR